MTTTATETRPTFGYELRRLRKERRLLQRELAKIAGVSRQTICYIERDRSQPSPETVLKLLDALDLPLKRIVRDEDLQSEEVQRLRDTLRPWVEAIDATWPMVRKRVRTFERRAATQIKRERKKAGITQQELADQTGLTDTEIRRLERYDFHGWSFSKLKRLCDELNLDIEGIWEDRPPRS